jgi:hypothetical protein
MKVSINLPLALLRELEAKAAIKGTTPKQLMLTLIARPAEPGTSLGS